MKIRGAVCALALGTLALGSVLTAGTQQSSVKTTTITAEMLRIRDGGEMYESLCAVCHGADGTGNGPAVQALDPPPANLTRLAQDNGGKYSFPDVSNAISGRYRSAEDQTAMPSWEEALLQATHNRALVRQKLYSLTKHVKSLQKR